MGISIRNALVAEAPSGFGWIISSVTSPSPLKPQVVPIGSLDSLVPIEMPCYTLLSTEFLYLFSPLYPFPYHSTNAHDPYAQYVRQATLNVRYDDPSKYIALKYKIPLESIKEIKVGPNSQWICVKYKSKQQIAGIVILFREKSVTEAFVEVCIKENISLDRDISWWSDAFNGFGKISGSQSVVWNGSNEQIEVEFLDQYWNAMRRKRSVFGWFQPSQVVVKTESAGIIRDDEVDQGSMQLYSCGAFVLPIHGSAPVVRSCSIIATQSYLYLTLERFFRVNTQV